MQQGQIIGQHDAQQQARRSEAAQRSKREAAEAAAARQRRAQLEARGAAMRRVMRGLGAGQLGRALATWRRHCCQMPQPQQRLAPRAGAAGAGRNRVGCGNRGQVGERARG